MTKKINFISFVFILCFIFACSQVSAHTNYPLTGKKWDNPDELKVFYDSSMDQTTDNNDSYKSITNDALYLWSSGLDYDISFIQTLNGGDYDVFVAAFDFGDIGWNGQCTTYDTNGITYLAYVKYNRFYTDGYTYDFNRGVGAHELGHSLGLDHVTTPDHVMCTHAAGRTATGPNSHDIAGVRNLYGI